MRLPVVVCAVVLALATRTSAEYECANSKGFPTINPIPAEWIHGEKKCFDISGNPTGPRLQVHQYNEFTFIIRQSPCVNYESPFIYLLIGDSQALLFDTGSTSSEKHFPLQEHVEMILHSHCQNHGIERSSLELVVAHSHAHGDHISGDPQFHGKPHTTVVAHGPDDVVKFFKLPGWEGTHGEYALSEAGSGRQVVGPRDLLIVPIPGHEASSIALYDCYTQLLLMGDSLYPGRLYLDDFKQGKRSIAHLKATLDSLHLSTKLVLGAHIEMTDKARVDYFRGSVYKPNEHTLPLKPYHLDLLDDTLHSMQKPAIVHKDDFIVWPFDLPKLEAKGREGVHGMVVMALSHVAGGAEREVYLSHIPMLEAPHDYQAVMQATMRIHDGALDELEGLYTLEPEKMSLNDVLEGRKGSFEASLYKGVYGGTNDLLRGGLRFDSVLGSFEHGGKEKGKVTVTVHRIRMDNRLHKDENMPVQELRYYSFGHVAHTSAANAQSSLFLVHRIHKGPDFDHVVEAHIQSCRDSTGTVGAPVIDTEEWYVVGRENTVGERLHEGQSVLIKRMGDPVETVCHIQIERNLSCLKGPDFYEFCDVENTTPII